MIQLSEAEFDSGIETHMLKLGYKKIGHGADQMVFEMHGSNDVIKIFGFDSYSDESHKMFRTWATYCMQNKSNQFLPKIHDWSEFHFEGQLYLQIRTERLIQISRPLGRALEHIVEQMLDDEPEEIADELYHIVGRKHAPSLGYLDSKDIDEVNQLAIHLGDKDFRKLFKTIADVVKLGLKKGYDIDLHRDNFMHRYDGIPVISDPWIV